MQQSHVMRNFQIMKKLKLLLHLSAYNTTTTYVASFAIKLFQKTCVSHYQLIHSFKFFHSIAASFFTLYSSFLHRVNGKQFAEALQVFYSFQNTLLFFLNGPFPASFSLFLSFQYTVDSKQMFNININFCRWLDSNRRPLVSDATALPTEPQPQPHS